MIGITLERCIVLFCSEGLDEGVEVVPPMAPLEPSIQPVVVEKKRVQLPLRSSRDAEDTIPVEIGVEDGISTTLSGPLVDLSMDDAPKVEDTSQLGATISMLQEVIRSVEGPTVPSSSGGVPSSTTASLALVDATKVGEVGASGVVVGENLEPQVAKNNGGLILELPSELEFRRAIQNFQTCMTEPKEILGLSRSAMKLCNGWCNWSKNVAAL
uniref:Uncharacterized protein n=1 Tax=Setaria viridis TaxID=4556 RepID=A0A4V6D6J3_SETVI|nr:uncharacterized protein LOC117858913 isoform X2 [Setaria viridis]TKW14316.1 hypothetical protein SEVIR_5G160500v2 [Setaria viridis]